MVGVVAGSGAAQVPVGDQTATIASSAMPQGVFFMSQIP